MTGPAIDYEGGGDTLRGGEDGDGAQGRDAKIMQSHYVFPPTSSDADRRFYYYGGAPPGVGFDPYSDGGDGDDYGGRASPDVRNFTGHPYLSDNPVGHGIVTPKDLVVIFFVLCLWLYSIGLMFRAWNRILNFSEDQLRGSTDKTMILWRWVLQHILLQKREEEREGGEEDGRDSGGTGSAPRSRKGSSAVSSPAKSPVAAGAAAEKGEVRQNDERHLRKSSGRSATVSINYECEIIPEDQEAAAKAAPQRGGGRPPEDGDEERLRGDGGGRSKGGGTMDASSPQPPPPCCGRRGCHPQHHGSQQQQQVTLKVEVESPDPTVDQTAVPPPPFDARVVTEAEAVAAQSGRPSLVLPVSPPAGPRRPRQRRCTLHVPTPLPVVAPERKCSCGVLLFPPPPQSTAAAPVPTERSASPRRKKSGSLALLELQTVSAEYVSTPTASGHLDRMRRMKRERRRRVGERKVGVVHPRGSVHVVGNLPSVEVRAPPEEEEEQAHGDPSEHHHRRERPKQ